MGARIVWGRAALGLVLLAVVLAPQRPVGELARPPGSPARERVLIGIVPELDIFAQKARFRPLQIYLERRLGVRVQLTILPHYGDAIAGLESGRLDGAFLGSLTSVLAVKRLGAIPLAREVNLDGTSTRRGHLFVRRDARIAGVEAMRGKRMAYVARATTAGYLFPLAWLRAQGIASPDALFAEQWFAGSQDAAVRAVLDGKTDVGAAEDGAFDRVRGEDPRVDRDLIILASSSPVPSSGLCVSRSLEDHLRDALLRALLELASEPDGPKVLETYGARGFVRTVAEDYAPVHELARAAGVELATHGYRD